MNPVMWWFPFISFHLFYFFIFDCMFHTFSDQMLVSSGWNHWFQTFQWAGYWHLPALIFELIVSVCITGVHKYTESKLFQHGRQRETHLLSTVAAVSAAVICIQVCSVFSETAQVCVYVLLEPRQLTQEFLALWCLSPKAANSIDSKSC